MGAPETVAGLLTYVPLLVGSVFTVGGLVGLHRTVPRWRRARSAPGVITAVGHHTMPSPGPAWRLTVAYRDQVGAQRQAVWVGASSLDLTTYRQGMPVQVRYDPQEPRWIYLPGGGRPHPVLLPVIFTVVGPVVVAVWALIVLG